MTTTAPVPSAPEATITEVIGRADNRSVVIADGTRIDVPVGVNRAAAARFLRTVRRVDRVEIDVDRLVAVASGRSHRLPFRRRIPVSMALGLARLGVVAACVGGRR